MLLLSYCREKKRTRKTTKTTTKVDQWSNRSIVLAFVVDQGERFWIFCLFIVVDYVRCFFLARRGPCAIALLPCQVACVLSISYLLQ